MLLMKYQSNNLIETKLLICDFPSETARLLAASTH